jgi:HJR/Mrr/RecB family endonuclease
MQGTFPKRSNLEDVFWSNFHGEKTLPKAISHFVQNYPYSKEEYKDEFATVIIRNIIGKPFEKRKLRELLDLELSRLDFSKSTNKKPTSAIGFVQEFSIFDADKLDGHDFEKFVADLLRSNEFTEVSATRGSGDQGGDILATRGDEKLVIQAKRYSIDKKVTNSAVQEVIGAIAWYNAKKGVVVTNSLFTKSAKELAEKNNIELWDRKKVSEFIQIHNNSAAQKKSKELDKEEVFDVYGENVIFCETCNYGNLKVSKICGKCGKVL